MTTCELHFAAKRLRLEAAESRVREEMIAKKGDERHHLATWHADTLTLLHSSEPIVAEEVSERFNDESRMLRRLAGMQCDASMSLLQFRLSHDPVHEETVRRQLVDEEQRAFSGLWRRETGLRASMGLLRVQQIETKWRQTIQDEEVTAFSEYASDFIPFLEQVFFLGLSASSERAHRWNLLQQEHQARIELCCNFCLLKLQWIAEWHRLTSRRIAALWHDELRDRMQIMRDAALDRTELRLLHEPVHRDFLEQIATRHQRQRRLQGKVAALTRLRQLEVQREALRRNDRDATVEAAKERELMEIEALQDAILLDVATAETRSDEGGDDRWKAMSAFHTHKLERLSQPDVPFRELVAYRKRLLGFDAAIEALEGRGSGPSIATLRTTSIATRAASMLSLSESCPPFRFETKQSAAHRHCEASSFDLPRRVIELPSRSSVPAHQTVSVVVVSSPLFTHLGGATTVQSSGSVSASGPDEDDGVDSLRRELRRCVRS